MYTEDFVHEQYTSARNQASLQVRQTHVMLELGEASLSDALWGFGNPTRYAMSITPESCMPEKRKVQGALSSL